MYFAKVARYINEHRKLALQSKPYGFENLTKFYTNVEFPPAYDKWSTQLVCLYVIQFIGAFMFGSMVSCISSIVIYKLIPQILLGFIFGILSFIISILLYVNYMKEQDLKLGVQDAKKK